MWKNKYPLNLIVFVMMVAVTLLGCQSEPQMADGHEMGEGETAETAHHGSAEIELEPRDELTDMESPVPLDASVDKTKEIGFVYEAFLSPEQEGGEEQDTPDIIPDVFKSTLPSVDRELRPSRGHAVLAFTNDLSKAYAFVSVEDVKLDEIVMFHIHCGRPGQLGPIIVDFRLRGDVKEFMADGTLKIEITNEDIEGVVSHGDGLVGALTAGCPITLALPTDKVKTIAGMQFIAEQGELYFNLHTAGQTYFGDIRGQLQRVD